MKPVTIKLIIMFISLLCWDVAIGAPTVNKCVDEKGAVSFTQFECPKNQHATDTGVVIDSRTEKEKAAHDTNVKKYLDDLHTKAQMTSTPAPTAAPDTSTQATPQPTESSILEDDCVTVSTQRRTGDCVDNQRDRTLIGTKLKANQLPANTGSNQR